MAYEWNRNIQEMVNGIDTHITCLSDGSLTLSQLAGRLGYSPQYTTRQFHRLTGMLGLGETRMSTEQLQKVRVYSQRFPAHLLLHIRNYESNGYWDFWQRQEAIPGQDCRTICGTLDSIKGKLDAESDVPGQFSGQLMAYVFEAGGRRAEAYGVRLPADWSGVRPEQMQLMGVEEGEYMVFEHPRFDYEKAGAAVHQQVSESANGYDYSKTEYVLDETAGRVGYFYFDPGRYCRIVRPVKRWVRC